MFIFNNTICIFKFIIMKKKLQIKKKFYQKLMHVIFLKWAQYAAFQVK